jgi:hypothetical protein
MIQRIIINVGGQVRHEDLDGRPHLVAPAAILPDGVITGNLGSCLYTKTENDKSVPSWNHRPLVVYHPKDDKGKFTSACSKAVLETRKVGITLNSSSDDKLRTEAWFDIEKTKAVDDRIITALEAGQPVECSTGLFADYKKKAGEYNGQKYKITARNYRPDHLAVFADKKGAYSVAAGGGILQVNEEPERNQHILSRTVTHKLKEIAAALNANELSFDQITRQLSDLLANKLGEPGKYWAGYICHVYPDRVIYSDGSSGLWMLDYSADGDAVSLGRSPEAVERVVEYRTKSGDSYSANEAGVLTKKETETVAKKFSKKAHIDSLIGNGYEESDREDLEKTPDKVLQAIKPITANEEDPDDDDEEEQPVKTKVKTGKITLNDFLANGDPRAVEAIKTQMKRHGREKKRLVNTIMANQKVFKEDYFKNKDVEELEGILAMIRNAGDAEEDGNDEEDRFLPSYRGAAGHADVTANEDGDDSGGAPGLPLDAE